MPIDRKYNCGCGFNTNEEIKAIDHVKETGHEVHGHIRILTKSKVERTESRPLHGMVVNGRFTPQEAR
jgi:hypothetical protein